MNKLEKLDNLLMYWKAKEEVAGKSGKPGLKSEFSKVILGLTLARGILKEPPNDVNSPGAKCCCETAAKDDWPCKICMAEYYERRR